MVWISLRDVLRIFTTGYTNTQFLVVPRLAQNKRYLYICYLNWGFLGSLLPQNLVIHSYKLWIIDTLYFGPSCQEGTSKLVYHCADYYWPIFYSCSLQTYNCLWINAVCYFYWASSWNVCMLTINQVIYLQMFF